MAMFNWTRVIPVSASLGEIKKSPSEFLAKLWFSLKKSKMVYPFPPHFCSQDLRVKVADKRHRQRIPIPCVGTSIPAWSSPLFTAIKLPPAGQRSKIDNESMADSNEGLTSKPSSEERGKTAYVSQKGIQGIGRARESR